MQTLQPCRNSFLILGIETYEKHPFNIRNVITYFMLIMGSLLNSVHLLYEADTFKEYADSVCATSSMIVATIMFTDLIYILRPFFNCMQQLEEIVDESE